MRAFRSEWIKLSRRNTLLGFGGAMIGFALLFTILAFVNAGGGNVDLDGGESDAMLTPAMLSLPEGSVFAITSVGGFLGIIALALFASNMAGEFNKGTIRMLFVTEPKRLKLLAGKVAALASFVAIGVGATLVATLGAGALMAPGAGVETAAWWTSDGLAAIGSAYVNLTAAALVPGLIATTIAVLTRSAPIAISAGVAYFILGETLLSSFWDSLAEWGPAAVMIALSMGGADGASMMGGTETVIGYTTAALLALGYAVVSLAISAAVLARRDVTS